MDKVMPELRGRTVAITGTSRGLGRALAIAFAGESARVVAHARREVDLAPVLRACEEQGAAGAIGVAGDLLDETLGDRIIRAARGRVDVLVLNAAVLGPMATAAEVLAEAFDGTLRQNVTAQLQLLQAVLPGMVAAGRGVVVGVSSGLGRFALPRYGAYTTSKHALEGLIKTVACEHEEDGVVAVAVSPGMVRTDMLREALGHDDLSGYQSPEETARAFVRMVKDLGPSHAGESLDVKAWFSRP